VTWREANGKSYWRYKIVMHVLFIIVISDSRLVGLEALQLLKLFAPVYRTGSVKNPAKNANVLLKIKMSNCILSWLFEYPCIYIYGNNKNVEVFTTGVAVWRGLLVDFG
jgi:hypothetical protein